MIFMGTQWIPFNKTEEWSKIYLNLTSKPLPSCIKKWQTFGCVDGERGIKGYNLIFVEKGKVDEAAVEISKLMLPFYEMEGFAWKLEPLMGMSDSLAALGKGR